MTPGDAADMNASTGLADSSAALKFAMSFWTAVRSFHSIGPLHAGRMTVERRSPRAAASGKSAEPQPDLLCNTPINGYGRQPPESGIAVSPTLLSRVDGHGVC